MSGDSFAFQKLLMSSSYIGLFHCDFQQRSPVHLASYYGQYDILTILVKLFPNEVNRADKNGYTPLDLACQKPNQEKCVEEIVTQPTFSVLERNPKNYMTLINACKYGYSKALTLLLSDTRIPIPQELDITGANLYLIACKSNKLDILMALSNDKRVKTVYFDRNLQGPLHYVCSSKNCNRSVVEYVISSGVDPNIQDKNGQTALHFSCSMSNVDAVECLLKLPNINVNLLNKDITAPIHIACSLTSNDILNKLMEHPKIDLNILDREKRSPLILAVVLQKKDIVKQLIFNPKVELNKFDKEFRTPFYIACSNQDVESVSLFLSSKKPLNLKALCSAAKFSALESISVNKRNSMFYNFASE